MELLRDGGLRLCDRAMVGLLSFRLSERDERCWCMELSRVGMDLPRVPLLVGVNRCELVEFDLEGAFLVAPR